jgi:hypothetical protein
MDGRQIGQRLPDTTGLLPLITYDPGNLPVLCGSSRLIALTYEKDELAWQVQFHQIFNVGTHPEGLLVLATEKQDGRCNLYSIDSEGKQRFSLPLGDAPANMDIEGDLAVIGCGTHVVVADVSQGKIILETDIAAEIIRVGFAEPHSVTVICQSGVRRLNIPD